MNRNEKSKLYNVLFIGSFIIGIIFAIFGNSLFSLIMGIIFLITSLIFLLILVVRWIIPQRKRNKNEVRNTQIELLKNVISKTIATQSGNFCINTFAKLNMQKAQRTYFIPEDFERLFKDGNSTLVFWKTGNDWQVETILTNDDDIANAIKNQIRENLSSHNLSKLQEMCGDLDEIKSIQGNIGMKKYTPKNPSSISPTNIIENYCVVDIETTGLSRTYDQIIEICALRVRKNEIVDTFTQLVKPTFPIPTTATRVNGITNEMVENAPSIKEVIAAFIEFIADDIVIGHNIGSFDLEFINNACTNEFGKPLDNDYIDTLPLSRIAFGGLYDYKLPTLCRELGIALSEHRAYADCISTKKLYDKIKASITST